MNRITKLAIALALAIGSGELAAAEVEHEHADHQDAESEHGTSEKAGHDMHEMMDMMMRMHARMKSSGMMGAGPGDGMAMMDGDMMRMMTGPGMMGGAMMAQPSPEQARGAMLARLAEFDADKDGSLSLSEFEALHAAMIREDTVDRFQYLDADGDGKVTEAEMAAPSQRMEMRQKMSGGSGMMGGQMPSGN